MTDMLGDQLFIRSKLTMKKEFLIDNGNPYDYNNATSLVGASNAKHIVRACCCD